MYCLFFVLISYLHLEEFRNLLDLGCCSVYDSVLILGGPGIVVV